MEVRSLFGLNSETPDGPTDPRTDRPTDRPTDGRTDKVSYRDAWTHLKSWRNSTKQGCIHNSIICVRVGRGNDKSYTSYLARKPPKIKHYRPTNQPADRVTYSAAIVTEWHRNGCNGLCVPWHSNDWAGIAERVLSELISVFCRWLFAGILKVSCVFSRVNATLYVLSRLKVARGLRLLALARPSKTIDGRFFSRSVTNQF